MYVESSDGETTDIDTDLAPANIEDVPAMELNHEIPQLNMDGPPADFSVQCSHVITAWNKNCADWQEAEDDAVKGREDILRRMEGSLALSTREVNRYARKLASARGRQAIRQSNVHAFAGALKAQRTVFRNRKNEAKSTVVMVAELFEAVKEGVTCPITHSPLTENPVVTQEGHTYNQGAIQQAFANSPGKSPMTNAAISEALVPNRAIANIAQSAAQLLD